MRFYTLDPNSHRVVQTGDMDAWEQWFSIYDRVVAKTPVKNFTVSTVFLAQDCGSVDDFPILFETMIFHKNRWAELYCERYRTWDEALAGHHRAVEAAEKMQEPQSYDYYD